MAQLEIHDLNKSYGPVAALRDVSLSVPAGCRTAIVGASGSGKTTLLRVIAGFEVPDSGRVLLEGQALADGRAIVPAHRRRIGYVPQDGALFPHLSVAENIGFGLARDDARRAARIRELMEMVSLDAAMLGRSPHQLSGGQQQRVALARALAQRPRLILLDEPFSALDTGLRAATRKAVAQLLAAHGITTILVTHDQAEALSFADQVAVMRDGALVQVGAPLDLYTRPADPHTARFLGDAMVLDAQLEAGWARCAIGRVAVNDRMRTGSARILLRPEQLQLDAPDSPAHLAAAGTPDDAACHGQVTESDFGGADCMLTVRVGELPQATLLQVRSAATLAPAVGSTVRIGVRGAAHVFPH